MSKRTATHEELRSTLTNLTIRIEEVFHSDEHKGIYEIAYVHGFKVNPENNFGKELQAAIKLLEETE